MKQAKLIGAEPRLSSSICHSAQPRSSLHTWRLLNPLSARRLVNDVVAVSVVSIILIFIDPRGSKYNKNLLQNLNRYKLIQNLQKLFTEDLYRNLNLPCLFLKTQLGRSIAN